MVAPLIRWPNSLCHYNTIHTGLHWCRH